MLQEHFSQIEIGEVNICSAVASSGKTIAIAGLNPPSIYVLDSADSTSAKEIDVSFIFPAVRGYYRPRITLRFLSDSRLLLHEEMVSCNSKLNDCSAFNITTLYDSLMVCRIDL